MSWFNRYVIGTLSPRWALARARYAQGVRAYYESTEPTRLRKSRPRSASADSLTDRSAVKLRDQARHLEENLDIASGALDVLVGNVVGSGVLPEPLVETTEGEPAEEFNRQLLKLWDEWIYAPEVTGQFDYYSLQRIVARSWLRDGESFGQRLIGRVPGLKHGTALPYSIEAFEADFVPIELADQGKKIRQGIEVDAWGRPKKYHVLRSHPGETTFWGAYDTVAHDADRILHLKMVKRLHQLRGITIFAPVLARLDDIKEIDESERVAARVAAAMAAYIKKGLPDLYTSPTTVNGVVQKRQMEFVPGMVFDDLEVGEDIGTINSNRPNNALIPFRDSQLRSASAGLMTSYSSLSKDYNGTYSAQRQELVEQFVTYRSLSGHFVFRWCQPIWDGFIDAVQAANAVEITSDIDVETLYNVSHTAPPMPWIDPESEVSAAILAEKHLYESKSSVIRKRGGNPDQVYREIQRERQELSRRGLSEPTEEGAGGENTQEQAQATARSVYRFQQRRAQ